MSPSGKQFEVLPGQSLLESGLAAGIALPFGCANGSCGDCKARIVSGEAVKVKHHDYSFTAAQKLNDMCLLCSNTAVSDVMVEVHEATSTQDIPYQQLTAKLCRMDQVENVNIVAFKFVRGNALRFLPGQRVKLTNSSGTTMEMPIASCPCNAQFVEFHFPLSTMEPTAFKRVTVTGPIGTFTLSEATEKPKLFIANGIEFGQLQGMIEQVLNSDLGTPCCLVWAASSDTRPYRLNWCRSMNHAFDEFQFEAPDKSENILGALPEEWLTRLDSSEVYLANEHSTLIQQLVEHGAKPSAIFYPDATEG